MLSTIKQRVIAGLVLLALVVIFLPMLLSDASRLKIKLWSIPSSPNAPAVAAIKELAAIKIVGVNAQHQQISAWALQLGTFADALQAQKLIMQLQAKNVSAYSETSIASTGAKHALLITVYAGPEVTQEGLEVLEKNLAQNFKIKGTVVTFTAIPVH